MACVTFQRQAQKGKMVMVIKRRDRARSQLNLCLLTGVSGLETTGTPLLTMSASPPATAQVCVPQFGGSRN